MAKYRVAFLGVFTPHILREMESQLPEDFEMVAVKSFDEQERIEAISGADFVLFSGDAPLTANQMDAGPRVRLIQKWGIGVDKIDLKAAAERNIPVANTAGSNSIVVAEHAILLMLATYKRLPYVDRNLRQGRWVKKEMRAVSYHLSGKTVGIVGFGNIGREVAKRVRAFNCRILYCDKFRPAAEVEQQLGAEFRPLDALLSESDIVTLHTPLTEETRKLIDARRLSLMKPTAILVNCARGGIVDEPALTEALRSGQILGAGLDVFAEEPAKAGNPLFELDNVVVSPHTAGSVIDNVANVARHCFANMARVARGEGLPASDIVLP